jgi:triacylglycerol esterase/lipase EstA (alpha/beta hydrolase family)
MLARIVLASLLLELLAYAALGAWLHAWRGWAPAALVALACASALLARLLLVGLTFALSWPHRSPRAPLGVRGWSRLLLLEWRALLADNLLYLPFESLLLRRDPAGRASTTPVLLVHGIYSNRGYFRPLVRSLEGAGGRMVFTGNFDVTLTSIERFAAQLRERIEAVAATSSQPRVVLVCHSMGGLAAREYLRVHGGERIERLVTIATPHHGTAMARFGVGTNARQMRRDHPFLARLQAFEGESGPGVPTLSVYAPHDNLVAPQATSLLPWARNVALPGLGHVSVLASSELRELLRAELAPKPGT